MKEIFRGRLFAKLMLLSVLVAGAALVTVGKLLPQGNDVIQDDASNTRQMFYYDKDQKLVRTKWEKPVKSEKSDKSEPVINYYDDLGRVVKTVEINSGNTTSYVYDGKNRLTEIIGPNR